MNDDEYDSDPTEADIVLRRGRKEPVTVRDIPVAAMQALYHEITGKTESLAKSYDKSYIVTLDAIRQLFFKLEQTLEQFEKRGYSNTITIRHKSGETLRFSSKEKFFQYDVSKTEPIKGIDLEFDFLEPIPEVVELMESVVIL